MRNLLMILFIFVNGFAYSADYLSSDEAFKVSVAQIDKANVNVSFKLAPGYDIYKNKIQIITTDSSSAKVADPVLPPAIMEHNDILGDYEIYKNNVSINLPITQFGNNKLILDIHYEGCKGLEYCFPAIEQIVPLTLNPDLVISAKSTTTSHQISIVDFISSDNGHQISNIYQRKIIFVFLCFFLVGILVAFTPCVFPMLPILLTIISGKNTSTKKSFILASCYVLGSSLSYAAAGVLAAKFGNALQGVLQSTYANIAIIVLFIIFSLSLFGLFTIQLPSSISNKLYGVGQQRISFLSAFIAGSISALVLSPCVTAPLAGALLYISYTGNIAIGGSSLFFMGLGMGLPLLLIAVFGNKFLPKSGKWMELVKYCFGYLMLLMAIYISSRLINSHWVQILCGVLLFIIAIHMTYGIFKNNIPRKIIIAMLPIAILVGAIYLIVPALESLHKTNRNLAALQFNVVYNIQDLDTALNNANKHMPVILDFTAQWCLACKEMELTTFSDPRIIDSLLKYTRIRVDVTKSNSFTQQLEKRYGVFAPPSLVFISQDGQVDNKSMVTGYINADKLYKILQNAQ